MRMTLLMMEMKAQDQDTVPTCGGPYRGHRRLSLLCVYTQNTVTVSGNRGYGGPNVYNKTCGQRFPRLDLLLWLVGNFSMFVYCSLSTSGSVLSGFLFPFFKMLKIFFYICVFIVLTHSMYMKFIKNIQTSICIDIDTISGVSVFPGPPAAIV